MNRVTLIGVLAERPLPFGGLKPAVSLCLLLKAHLPHRDRPLIDTIPVTAFGRTAEACLAELRRGSRVLLEGRLRFERWKSARYGRKSRLTVVAERIECLSEPPAQAPPEPAPLPAPSRAPAAPPTSPPAPVTR